MRRAARRQLFIAVALSLYIVFITVYMSIFGKTVLFTLKGVDPVYVLLSMSSYLGIQFAWGFKWFIHVRKVVGKASYLYVLTANMMGNFFSLTTPSARLAGDPLRAGAVSRRYITPFSYIFATVMVDKMGLTSGMILIMIPIIAYSIALYNLPIEIKVFFISFFIFWIIVGTAVFLTIRSMKGWKAEKVVDLGININRFFRWRSTFDREELITKVRKGIKRFRDSIKEQLEDPLTISLDQIMVLTMYLLRFASAYMLFIAIGYHVDFVVVSIAVMISYIVSMMSQLPGTVGIGEAAMTAMYSAMGIGPGPALTVAVLSQLNTYIFELGLGYISAWIINFLGVSMKVKPS